MRKKYGIQVKSKLLLALISIFIFMLIFASAASSQMLGDVNFDGVIDIRDVVLVQRHILGYQPPLSSAQLTAADVNGDGIVNVVDVNLIMQYVQGYINSFPTQYLYTPVLILPGEAASLSGSMVSFQWGAVSGATRYQLEITKLSDNTTFRTVDLGNVTSTTQYAFADDGTQYRWRVRAGNSTQWGAWSVYRTFTNGAALPAPTLGAPAENAALDSTSVSFQWSAVTGATRYHLEIIRISDGYIFKNLELGNLVNTTVSDFPNDGTEYRWRVRAGNATSWGNWSVYRYFTSGVILPAPTLTAPANNTDISDTSVLFRWNEVSGATKYQLEVLKGSESLPFKDVVLGNITMSEQFGFLRDGTEYRWRVRAGNNAGWGAWSSYFTLTSGQLPPAPTLSLPADTATITGTQISFQWNAVAGANKYELEIVDERNGSFFTKAILADVTSSVQKGFPNDSSNYKWRVRAGSTEGWGDWSAYRYFTNGNPPAGPVLIRPANNETINGERVTFEWNPVPGADRYELLVEYDIPGGTEFRRVNLGLVHATRQTDFPNDGSQFSWSIRSGNANGWGTWSQTRTFTNGSPFSYVVLQTPAAYSTQSGTSIPFSWDSVNGATSYNLVIVDVRTGVTKTNQNLTGTSTTQTDFTDDGSEYKWRVRAGDDSRWGAWSAYRYFINQTVTAGTPSAPSLLSPAVNATAATETIEFEWSPSAGATNYELQVVRVEGGAVVVGGALGSTDTTSSQSGFPNDGSEYMWRVKAKNATGWGPWSFYRSFTNGTWWTFPF
jgi:hypothetical protein